jgi:riboflavin biosynthesis pyrimidine reductase
MTHGPEGRPAIGPLTVVLDRTDGELLALPPPIDRLYGALRFPGAGQGWVMANFAATLDGIVVLDRDRPGAGTDITGGLREDRMVMGLLRALADTVVVGAGTFRAVPRHRWTPEGIFPDLAEPYRRLRDSLGLAPRPGNAIVTARGELPADRPLFAEGRVPTRLVTTAEGARRLRRSAWPPSVEIIEAGTGPRLSPSEVLAAVSGLGPSGRVLLEGGPHLLADFVAARALDELFVTVAPRLAGRSPGDRRLGLIEGELPGPEPARRGALIDARRLGGYLFLRYRWPRAPPGP